MAAEGAAMNLSRDGRRCEWRVMEAVDRLHTLLADDCRRAGDRRRAEWHINRRNYLRRQVDAAASIFCRRPVTGYTTGPDR